ncbi:MAG: hypothetical protein CVT95_06405, partial [Bacteroidetes bacterium HGW-Bacteroidetes-12]
TSSCPPNQPWVSYACGICNPAINHIYTTGRVEGKSDFSFKFGYIEARIKLSDLKRTIPAFWTFNAFPDPYNEIDIFEMTPGMNPNDCDNGNQTGVIAHNKNIMTSNIHLSANGLGCNEPYFKPTYINDYTQWHTYAIEWSPSKMIWYVDNSVVRIALNPGIIYPQSVIFSIPPLDSIALLNNLFLPVHMLVDYVKVYQKQEDCANLINVCNYNFATHDNQVKNSITIGDNGCNNSVAVGSNTTIRASEFITLNGEVTLPLGSEFYADANGECATALDMRCSQIFNPCFFIFSNYDNQVKQLIALGGNNCTINITSSSNLTLQATESITLDAGVTIMPQSGKSVVVEIKNCPQ